MKVFDSGYVRSNQLDWHLQNDEGFIVANGVYLYVVTIRGYDGSIIRSEVTSGRASRDRWPCPS